jgi:hypothetical protein
MAFHIPQLDPRVLWTLAYAAALVAAWRGGWEGRVVGVLLAVNVTLAVLFDLSSAGAGLLIDGVSLAVCLAVTLRSGRYWTVWVAGAQLLMLVTDMLELLFGLGVWAYLSAQIVWSYVFDTALLVGSLLTPRARKTGA